MIIRRFWLRVWLHLAIVVYRLTGSAKAMDAVFNVGKLAVPR